MTTIKNSILGTTISYLSSTEKQITKEGVVWSEGPVVNSVWVKSGQSFSDMVAVKLGNKNKSSYALDFSPSLDEWVEKKQPPEKPGLPYPWKDMGPEEIERSAVFVNLSIARDTAREMAFKLQNWAISRNFSESEAKDFTKFSDEYLLAAAHLEHMASLSLVRGDFFSVNYYGHHTTDYQHLGLNPRKLSHWKK